MAQKTTITELRKMQADDLQREIVGKRMTIAKIRMGIAARQEKDTSKVRHEKKELARMLTAMREKQGENALKGSRKTATVSAPQDSRLKTRDSKKSSSSRS